MCDASHCGFCAPFKDEPLTVTVCSTYGDLCRSMTNAGDYVDAISVLALSAVTGCKLQTFSHANFILFATPSNTMFGWAWC